jgi:hypothetical protein
MPLITTDGENSFTTTGRGAAGLVSAEPEADEVSESQQAFVHGFALVLAEHTPFLQQDSPDFFVDLPLVLTASWQRLSE